MRLIETKTLKLVEVWTELAPTYAILSHRWTDEEISLAEFVKPQANTKDKSGWHKITDAAQQALSDGYAYLWIDTCCIDKTSSAELSEAINSMYRWYQQSGLCYVYLNDVPHKGAFVADPANSVTSPFERSKWHTRGWTLQELLAPATIHFYSHEWKRLDADTKIDIYSHLSRATGIEIDILRGITAVSSTSIAKRMSWASERQTTRTEDIAYCLLGIFDVNMPMLYGEGSKAFIRLQEEIMKTSRDQTLFVWTHVKDDPVHTGLLARHPQNFRDSAHFEDKSQLPEFDGLGYQAGREGITISLFLKENDAALENVGGSSSLDPVVSEDKPQLCNAILKCAERDGADRFASIQLVRYGPHYMRQRRTKPQFSRLAGVSGDVFVRHQMPPQPAVKLKQEYLRILFETNCPNAYIFAMPSRTKAPAPLLRSKKARAAAAPALAHNAELARQVAAKFGKRIASLDEGDIPMRELMWNKSEIFWPMDYELGYNVPIQDLKWKIPLLPRTIIAYMRIVPGIKDRECQGLSIGIDANAEFGFNCGHRSTRNGAVHDSICTDSIGFRSDYSVFFQRRYFDRPTAADEIAEVKISLRHHEESDMSLNGTERWEHKPGSDQCPCALTSP